MQQKCLKTVVERAVPSRTTGRPCRRPQLHRKLPASLLTAYLTVSLQFATKLIEATFSDDTLSVYL